MVYRQNIAIIGLFTGFNMECARVMADDFESHFLDANKYLEYNVTYTIRQIIEDYGIDYFLKCERKTYKELMDFNNSIIGVSSTALLQPDNIRNLRKSSYIIMLKANEQITKRKFLKDPQNNLKEFMLNDFVTITKTINEVIEPLCDIIVDTYRMTPVRAATYAENELTKLLMLEETEVK